MFRIASPTGVKTLTGSIVVNDDVLRDLQGNHVLGWFALIGHEIRCGGAKVVAVLDEAGLGRQVLILQTEGAARYSVLDDDNDVISNVVLHFEAIGLLPVFPCDAVRIDDGPALSNPRTGAVIE